MRFVFVAVLVMIAGCQETVHCGPGLYGRNCDQALVVRDGGPDTNMDGGTDGGSEVDANVDAYVDPCDSCLDTEVCYDGGDGGTPRCVECVTNDVCEQARPDGGVPGVPICLNFECAFGCEDDEDCGGLACRPNHECSEYARAQDVCEPCDTDFNCMGATSRCVSFDNNGHPGTYCLADDSDVACAERRRFTSSLNIVESVDDPAVANYCIPSAVTCEAVLSAGTACTTSATCGVVDGTGTGVCVAATYCTYTCNTLHVNADCPTPMTCNGASSTCTR